MIREQEGTAPLYLECRKERDWLKEWGITVPCCTSGRESSSKPSTPGFGPLSLRRIRSSVGTAPPSLANSASLELSLLNDDFAGVASKLRLRGRNGKRRMRGQTGKGRGALGARGGWKDGVSPGTRNELREVICHGVEKYQHTWKATAKGMISDGVKAFLNSISSSRDQRRKGEEEVCSDDEEWAWRDVDAQQRVAGEIDAGGRPREGRVALRAGGGRKYAAVARAKWEAVHARGRPGKAGEWAWAAGRKTVYRRRECDPGMRTGVLEAREERPWLVLLQSATASVYFKCSTLGLGFPVPSPHIEPGSSEARPGPKK
ncbi:hypothetical protein C8R44DRAFT_723812 [Mycena epipterygia]|nr:hypothetical protein C8R44DRAFT_723812 [Mycena epipterygia]